MKHMVDLFDLATKWEADNVQRRVVGHFEDYVDLTKVDILYDSTEQQVDRAPLRYAAGSYAKTYSLCAVNLIIYEDSQPESVSQSHL